MMPEIRTEAVRARDVEQIASTLRDMAQAGAMLMPNDPVIVQLRDLMGVERPLEEDDLDKLIDGMGDPDNDDDDPDDPNDDDPEDNDE